MLRNDRVNSKATLSGRKTIIAPLSGKNRNQFGTPCQSLQDIRCCSACIVKIRMPQYSTQQGTQERRNQFLGKEKTGAPDAAVNGLDVLINGTSILGKVTLHALAEVIDAGVKIKRSITDDHAIVYIRHSGPLQTSITDVIEDPASLRLGILNLADIVNSDIPFEART